MGDELLLSIQWFQATSLIKAPGVPYTQGARIDGGINWGKGCLCTRTNTPTHMCILGAVTKQSVTNGTATRTMWET